MRPYFSANLVLTWNYKVNTNHIDWSEHLNNNRDIEKKRTRKSSDSQKIEYCNTANTYEAKNRKSCNTNTRPEERKRMCGFSVAELTEKKNKVEKRTKSRKHEKQKKSSTHRDFFRCCHTNKELRYLWTLFCSRNKKLFK